MVEEKAGKDGRKEKLVEEKARKVKKVEKNGYVRHRREAKLPWQRDAPLTHSSW